MRTLIYAGILGAIFMWSIDNIPDLAGYVVIGLILLFIIKLIKGKS